jgi:hypothetical protein
VEPQGNLYRLYAPRTQTPWRAGVLEREFLTFEFFDTLKSDYNDGFVQRCKKAHERRPSN